MSGEPLQYILGHWPFRSLDLDVDSRVLIPRPETEELIDVALAQFARSDAIAPLILDLGCGSGAMGLSLLVELELRGIRASLVAADNSDGALAVCRRNAIKHRALAVTFVKSWWYDELPPDLRGQFDLIVANPPYVGAREFETLDVGLTFEPRDALVANDSCGVEGFADVERVISGSLDWLSPRGRLVCEHGAAQGPAAVEVARRWGLADPVTVTDAGGRNRAIVTGHW